MAKKKENIISEDIIQEVNESPAESVRNFLKEKQKETVKGSTVKKENFIYMKTTTKFKVEAKTFQFNGQQILRFTFEGNDSVSVVGTTPEEYFWDAFKDTVSEVIIVLEFTESPFPMRAMVFLTKEYLNGFDIMPDSEGRYNVKLLTPVDLITMGRSSI